MNDIKPRTIYLLRRTDKEDDGTDLYVGSTSMDLNKRLCDHRSSANNIRKHMNTRLYVRMREVGTINWEIVPLLLFTCDRMTILNLEKGWINTLSADLNTLPPITTPDERKERKARYYESNKEAILGYHVKYYKSNKEVINQQHAKYYKSSKETINQQHIKYRKSNKQNKVHYCNVCDKSFECKRDLQRHFDSLKHQYTYLNSLD